MDCFICNLLKNENHIVYKFNHGSVFLHENQFFYGRIFYALNYHWHDISEIPDDVYAKTCNDLQLLTRAVKAVFTPDHINIASLGNYASHVHWHIIPRYKSDPCWGEPPWPHGEKNLLPNEYEELKLSMNNAITRLI